MKRFFRHNPLSTLLATLALAAGAFLPFGTVANAAPPTSICPSFEEGGPQCDLVISAPESVAAGQPFTVKVAITDFEQHMVVPPNDPCASKVVVTLNVFITEGPPFATYTANASKGVATFTVGGLPATSFAELDASAVQTAGSCGYEEEFLGFRVVDVPAGQPIAPCPNDVPCTQTTSGSGTAATLFAASGNGSFGPATDSSFFNSLVAVDGGHGCGDGGPPDPNGVLGYHFSDPGVTKTIILEVSPGLVNKGIGQINVCWSFDASTWFFLQACSKTNGPPCVAHKNGLAQDGAYIEIDAPAGITDPWAYED